jgi:hypothetical protein
MSATGSDSRSRDPRDSSLRFPRPLWFGLAASVLVIVVIGVQIGVPIYRQQSAIREIERLGGTIQLRPRGPTWLRDRLGDSVPRAVDEVVGVYLRDCPATDETLQCVRHLTGLKALSISNTRVTDAGLADLNRLVRLERLWLANTAVTDAGLAHLKDLPALQELWLENTQVSDAGLAHLKGLTSLEGLWLDNTQVTGAGVAEVQRAIPGLTVGALVNNP